MKRMRTILLHRRVLMVMVPLLLGAMLNVLVVLSCSVPTGKNSAVKTYINADWTREEIFVHRWFGGGHAHYWTRKLQPLAANVGLTPDAAEGTFDDLPGWIDLRRLKHWNERHARGWPALCAYYEVPPDEEYEGGWKIKLPGWWSKSTTKETRIIPLRPLFPGLLLNTLCYAAVMWIGWLMWTSVRAKRRRRKGLCAGCGYDLRGADHAVCPECGKPLSAAPGGAN